MTVQDAITQFALYKKDVSDVSQADFLSWLNQINRYAWRLILSEDPDRIVATASYSTVGAQAPSVQALPADFKDIQPWNTGFFLLDANGNVINQRLILTSPSSQLWGYYLQGSNVVFTSPQSQSYVLRYIPKVTALTAVSDDLCIPDEYMEYAIKALDVFYSQWDEDYTAEGIADQRFARVMDEFCEDIRKAPMAFDMPDYGSTFTSTGSGFGFGATWY
jgi:hypothetical protein